MLAWLRSAGRGLATSPAAQLAIGAVIPGRAPGALGVAVLGGALGIAVLVVWPRLPDFVRSPPDSTATAVVIAIVAVAGVAVFGDAMTDSGDWGPQRAVLSHVMPALPGLDLPVWNQAVSTGDAPLELYPSLAYLVTGYVALGLGLTHDLPLALMIVAVIIHLTIAVATAAIGLTADAGRCRVRHRHDDLLALHPGDHQRERVRVLPGA